MTTDELCKLAGAITVTRGAVVLVNPSQVDITLDGEVAGTFLWDEVDEGWYAQSAIWRRHLGAVNEIGDVFVVLGKILKSFR